MMNEISGILPLLAQDNAQKGDPYFSMLFPMVAIAVLWYFLLLRPQRREQIRKQDMLSSLKKNDRIVTIGGIMGTVANVAPDGKEVTIKVDDNTRIKFLRSSIQSILSDESGGDAAKSTP